jgi:hypothetical protein
VIILKEAPEKVNIFSVQTAREISELLRERKDAF